MPTSYSVNGSFFTDGLLFAPSSNFSTSHCTSTLTAFDVIAYLRTCFPTNLLTGLTAYLVADRRLCPVTPTDLAIHTQRKTGRDHSEHTDRDKEAETDTPEHTHTQILYQHLSVMCEKFVCLSDHSKHTDRDKEAETDTPEHTYTHKYYTNVFL